MVRERRAGGVIVAAMQDFRNLIAWQKAHALEGRVDLILGRVREKRPVLADQIERAANSIAANIAEGAGRTSRKDFGRFLINAIGSSTELENHLMRARRLWLISEEELNGLIEATTEVRKIIYGLKKALNAA
jgi:four helix bundle protein